MTVASTQSLRRPLLVGLVLALGLLGLTLADHWIWAHTWVGSAEAVTKLETKDWYRALRELGFLPTWIVVGLFLMLNDRMPAIPIVWRLLAGRGTLVILSAGLGGLAAELLKTLTHRLRPGETGTYVFNFALDGLTGPGADALKKLGFGLASSHTGVAFGAAFMLVRLFPKTTYLAPALALGCGITRLLAGAHFATDVYVAAVMSYAVAAVMWRYTRAAGVERQAVGPNVDAAK